MHSEIISLRYVLNILKTVSQEILYNSEEDEFILYTLTPHKVYF
jgi:hypothetical protein